MQSMQEILNRLGVNINVSFFIIFFSLIWVRILMMVSVVPFLFGKPVPRYVLVATSFALAAFTYTVLAPATPPPLTEDMLALVMLYVKEIFYGLAIGIAVSIIFHSFSAVGQMVDNQRGISIARVLIPQLGEQASISSLFLYQFGVVIFLAVGGHLAFLQTFFEGFRALPVLAFPTAGPGLFALADLFIRVTGEVIFISLQLSMPVIIVIFLADIILGVANRVAPQIDVWMLGFTLKGYVGLLALFVSITMIGDQVVYYGQKANQYTSDVILLMQGKVPPDAPKLIIPEDGRPKFEKGVPRVETR